MFADAGTGSFRSQVRGETYSRLEVLINMIYATSAHMHTCNMQARSMVGGSLFREKKQTQHYS